MADDPHPPFQLRSQRLGALPIVDRLLGRIGLEALLERHLELGDRRVALPATVAIGLLVRNLCVAREPLYGLADWAERFDPGLLGLGAGESELLNDDRVGRALDALFDADRASLLTELMLGVIAEFEVDCSQLHNDSTSITLHGDYHQADGRQRAGKPTAAAALGHSKDHRPDLKQFVLTLTVSADGAVPLAHRLLDGNVTDDQTHIQTWDGLVALVGRPDFLYVADSKLATREQMTHIHSRGGRFVSILPPAVTSEDSPRRRASRCGRARRRRRRALADLRDHRDDPGQLPTGKARPARRQDALPQNRQDRLHAHLHRRPRQGRLRRRHRRLLPIGQQRPRAL
ncbi:MAG: IS1634 family transposase [Actinobacteria bacterium]|nr:IS1634 family transposase [Actinomycetota bacterium]